MKKRILVTFLSAVTLISCSSALAADYSDVNQSAWYASYVNKISELNAFSGYEDGTFRPDNQITQEEFIKTVVCLICGELNESNAPTVKNTWNSKWSSWAIPYLDKAFELGLITEQDTMFKLVGIPCNRGEMAKVITRAVEYLKEDSVADTSTYITKLKDYNRMKEEYKPYVLQAYAKGILSGYDDGTFRDDGLLTRAEVSSVLVRLIDKNERVNSDETLYDYFGRKVTWTEPLRTDVPEQYQVSISDHEVISQASYDRAMANGGSISKYELNRSKAMMFEDLVLQSIRYDGDTVTLTVPDYLPESQRWVISFSYWDGEEEYAKDENGGTTLNGYNVKYINITGPGEYSYSGIKYVGNICVCICPKDSSSFTSMINIDYCNALSYTRRDKPVISFNNMHDNFEWVQGQGYKDYIKDFDGEIAYPVEW